MLGIALIAVASVGVAASVFAVTQAEQERIDAAGASLERLDHLVGVLDAAVGQQEVSLDDYVLSNEASALSTYQDAVSAETRTIAAIHDGSFGEPDADAGADILGALCSDWRSLIADPAIRARQSSNAAGISTFATEAVNDRSAIDNARTRLISVVDDAHSALGDRSAVLSAARAVATWTSFAILFVAFGLAMILVRRFSRTVERDARDAGVVNRFTEVASFAGEDAEIAAANLVALGRLVHPDASVTHVLNRSMDRAVPEATTGEAIAEVLPLHALERCAGMLRGSMFIADDLADDLSVHCPIYPATEGTLVCIPLVSGERVGAVHLYWSTPLALPLTQRAGVVRITEHAALAIGNRRLLAALQGQADTDARTGLANSRAFDRAMEEKLAARSSTESMSVLMVDIDHFKEFNDHHGHPAGDEALRVFAGVLRSCLRDGDLAARYGGEEFAVLLPGNDRGAALAIAERIRSRTESTIVSLAPGLTDRITVSIGVATAPDHALDRITLLRLADEALYRAKEAGRNRVVVVATDEATPDARSAAAEVPLVAAGRRRAARAEASG
jgi:diguanylate cyclase (GGDEF)-like protein